MEKKDKKPYKALVPFIVTGVIWIIGAIALPVHEIGILLLVFAVGAVAFILTSYAVSKRTHLPADTVLEREKPIEQSDTNDNDDGDFFKQSNSEGL